MSTLASAALRSASLHTKRLLHRSNPQRANLIAENQSLHAGLHASASASARLLLTSACRVRAFSTSFPSRAVVAQHPPSQPTVLLAYPSVHDAAEEDADEPEVDFVPPEEATIEITDRAAEQQLRSIANRENNPDAALRIAVESGGCHGYQYKMELAKGRQPDDYHFSHPIVKPSNILVDAVSMALLKGSTIDFATELIGSSFRIADNPQAKGSGCGCGVSWELNI
ncbi:hypothetical protein WOLCODRAFT_140061 [Wolfiporia cocos MD-104 SS10]|uniref:Core domain-containing protein n=1 Tax=Wolfiporia cocos (strain MD-104) TaxID=742152 RepID=A0A2H3J0I3_WOLCO|nr:hypothetical protein WOLCODRAFT_140061 [Wolfiporia cocos MD-104 SS10]